MKMRTLFVTSALLCMLAAAFGTAGASPRYVSTITVLSPNHQGMVNSSTVGFSWSYGYDHSYKLTIRSVDGLQNVSVTFNAIGPCITVICNYSFMPEAYGWVWRENTAYQWQVKGYNYEGELAGKSEKRKFTTDIVQPIVLLAPSAGQPVSQIGSVNFSWQNDYTIDEFRLLITRPNGSKIKTTWIPRANICNSVDCIYNFSFMEFETGSYRWKVLGRDAGVDQGMKSAKRTLFVQ